MKPGDFLIGVLDFFAILLPGAVATWIATWYLPEGFVSQHLWLRGDGCSTDAAILWTGFLLSSYVLGHFVFMGGSRIDTAYDRRRQRTRPESEDKTFQAANKLRERLTPDLKGARFTTLKWSKAFIQLKAPDARAEIDRLEATSKFFRSLVVVSIPLALHFLLTERQPVIGLICLGLCGLAYSRYSDQRDKMSELSFATAVLLAAAGPPGPKAAPPPAAD